MARKKGEQTVTTQQLAEQICSYLQKRQPIGLDATTIMEWLGEDGYEFDDDVTCAREISEALNKRDLISVKLIVVHPPKQPCTLRPMFQLAEAHIVDPALSGLASAAPG